MRRVSSASFMIEPANLWQRRITRRFLDNAPVIDASDGEPAFRLPSEKLRIPLASIPWHSDPIASQNDSWLRVEALEAAGIDAEVIYPTFAWHLLAIADEALRSACLQAYNDWLMDFCGASAWRLNGAVLVSGGEAGRLELTRRLAQGARAVVIGVNDREPIDEVIAAATAADLPILLTRAGGAAPGPDLARFARESEELALAHATPGARFIVIGPGAATPPGVLRVTADQTPGSAWGLLDRPIAGEGEAAFLRGIGIAFHGLKTSA